MAGRGGGGHGGGHGGHGGRGGRGRGFRGRGGYGGFYGCQNCLDEGCYHCLDNQPEVLVLRENYPVLSGDDVGAGYGNYLQFLQRRYPNRRWPVMRGEGYTARLTPFDLQGDCGIKRGW